MRTIALSTITIGTLLVPLLPMTAAQAQSTRTWVSGTGSDANPCSRTAPCQTFAGAISKTADNGEINCLDSSGFGAVTISKNMTIDCKSVHGSILASGVSGVTISHATAGTQLHVVLRGLAINGTSGCVSPPTPGCLPSTPGTNGIRMLVGGTLHVEHSIIENFTAAGTGFGIDFAPATTGHLTVWNTSFVNNGNATTGGAIRVRPTGGTASALIDGSILGRGRVGLILDGFGGGTGINVTLANSSVARNTSDGVLVTSTVAASAKVDRVAISNNGGVGLNTANAGATIRVGFSSLTGNATATAGNTLSYGNNMINGNGVDTIPGLVPGGLH